MAMEKKKITQWVVYVSGVAVAFVVLVVGLALLGMNLQSLIGPSVILLVLAASVGAGTLWAYCSIMTGFWLAERGWFM